MAEWVKRLPTKPDNQSSHLRMHMVEGREKTLTSCSPTSVCVSRHTCTYTKYIMGFFFFQKTLRFIQIGKQEVRGGTSGWDK